MHANGDIHMAEFYASITNTTLLLFAQEDGSLQDDTGDTIAVHEYLGEV